MRHRNIYIYTKGTIRENQIAKIFLYLNRIKKKKHVIFILK